MRTPRRWVLFICLGFPLFLTCVSLAHAAQVGEWTLKVKADRAEVRVKAEPSGRVVTTLAKGTVVTSWAKEGQWFRVLIEPGREGFLVFGYLAPRDVDIVETAQATLDYWPQVSAEYGGAGISVRLGGGFLVFPGGDIETGTSGMFERTAAMISSFGDTIEEKTWAPFHSGYDLTGDVIYRLGGKTGVGLRADYIYTSVEGLLRFRPAGGGKEYAMWSQSDMSVISLRPGFYYRFPLNRLLEFWVDGGPAVYFADYGFNLSYTRINIEQMFQQTVKAAGLGLQGGAGLALRLNLRSELFLGIQGRYARIDNLKGEEEYYRWEGEETPPSSNPIEVRTKVKGYLYYGESDGYPALAVQENGSAAGGNARRVVLDLSGISLAIGFRVKF